ncbi:MAG TPA: hypothetical protein VF184_05820 [Phycisphaeraceae bacterium]
MIACGCFGVGLPGVTLAQSPAANAGKRPLMFSELPADQQAQILGAVAPPPLPQREAPYSTPMYYLLAKGFGAGANGELRLERNRPDWQEVLIRDWAELGLTSTHFYTGPTKWQNPDYVQAVRDFRRLSQKYGLKIGVRLGGDEQFQGIEGSGWNMHPRNPENRIDEYVQWVAQVAQTFKGQAEYYIVGDEVNANLWEESVGDGTRTYASAPEERRWTPEIYMQVFTKISQAIKSADPEAKTCMFGMAGLDWGYVKALHELGYTRIADGIAANPGFSASQAVIDFVAKVRSLSPNMKLYSNGVGYVPAKVDNPFPSNATNYTYMDDQTQAIMVAKGFISLFDIGWDYTPYYILIRQWVLPDGRTAPHWYGFFGLCDLVLDEHGNLTVKHYPAWYAMRTVAHVFHSRSNTQPAPERIHLSEPVDHAASYVRNGYEKLIVLWNDSDDASGKQVTTTLQIAGTKYTYPVRIPLYNHCNVQDVPYRIERNAVVIDNLTVGPGPVILRLVAHEQAFAE